MKRQPTLMIVRADPIVLRREAAALAMGVSVSLFEQLVRQGVYPAARALSKGSSGWLYAELQACAQALPLSDLPPGPAAKKRAPQDEPTAG